MEDILRSRILHNNFLSPKTQKNISLHQVFLTHLHTSRVSSKSTSQLLLCQPSFDLYPLLILLVSGFVFQCYLNFTVLLSSIGLNNVKTEIKTYLPVPVTTLQHQEDHRARTKTLRLENWFPRVSTKTFLFKQCANLSL